MQHNCTTCIVQLFIGIALLSPKFLSFVRWSHDGRAAKRAYCNTKGSYLAPLVHVKISLASPLYTRRRALAQSCIFEHQRCQMKSFSLPSSAPASASTVDSAAPAFFSSSKSTLSLRRFRTLVTFPSGDAGRLGGPSTSVCRYACSASRCA